MITQHELHERLSYDPETGMFRWRHKRRGLRAGSIAGTILSNGYRRIKQGSVLYLAHRLAWFYVHGEWPQRDIDHINGDRDDNRIENLRQATRSQNCMNAGDVSGITWDKDRGRWRAHIKKDYKSYFLGRFDTRAEALIARRNAEQELFGAYARAATCA